MTKPTLTTAAHTYREAWLADAAERFRPIFAEKGHPLPDKISFAVAFPSTGMRSNRVGEHWHYSATADGTATVIIRADQADALTVLGILAHELCHAAAPADAKHGPKFKKIAEAMGLCGKMSQAMPGPELNQWLSVLLNTLGPLPHSRLNWTKENKPKKPAIKWVKCVCSDCGYEAKVVENLVALAGMPICPIDNMQLVSDQGE